MYNIDKQYLELIHRTLIAGSKKDDRTGVGTISTFGNMMRFKPGEEFPIVSVKKTNFNAALQELLWMLNSVPKEYTERGFGPSNIKYLVDNDVKIWNEWPYKAYLESSDDKWLVVENGINRKYTLAEFHQKVKESDEFALEFGDLGPVYGQMWRFWPDHKEGRTIDQVQNVIDDLKHNPNSRRIMVSAWNPAEVPNQILPPCHYEYQLYTRPLGLHERLDIIANAPADTYSDQEGSYIKLDADYKSKDYSALEPSDKAAINATLDEYGVPNKAVSMLFNMRSVDVVLGLPFDIVSYAAQLLIIAQVVNMVPEDLVVFLGDTHIYSNHVDGLKKFCDNEPKPACKLVITDPSIRNINDFRPEHFKLEGYDPHPFVKFQVAV
jgi:thymidylate synthase